MVFNNREIAIGVWSILILALLLLKRDIRESFFGVIKALFAKKIQQIYWAFVLYCICGILILRLVKLWTPEELKDFVLWMIFSGFFLLVNFTKARKEKNYFAEAVKENFKISVIIEFILGLYTFNLAVEIITIPILIFIVVLDAFADSRLIPDVDPVTINVVKKVSRICLTIYGIILLVYTLYSIKRDYIEFATLDTFRDFILSPFLALWVLPFIYFLSTYSEYELSFIRLGMLKEISPGILRYAKTQSIINFRFDIDGLRRWVDEFSGLPSATKVDVNRTIKIIKRLEQIEKKPPVVSFERGWSPYISKDFLKEEGFETGYYKRLFDDEWFCSSNYIKTDDIFTSPTLSYNVIGVESEAYKLEICLSSFTSENDSKALQKMAAICDKLTKKSINQPLPDEALCAILKKENLDCTVDDINIHVIFQPYQNSNGYSLCYEIVHKTSTALL